jgi:hypothetical protein
MLAFSLIYRKIKCHNNNKIETWSLDLYLSKFSTISSSIWVSFFGYNAKYTFTYIFQCALRKYTDQFLEYLCSGEWFLDIEKGTKPPLLEALWN